MLVAFGASTVHCSFVLFQLCSKGILWTSMLCRNDTCWCFRWIEKRRCPTGPVHSGNRSRRLFPSPRTLKSAFLFARTRTTQCQSSTLTGSSTSQCLRFLGRCVEAVKHIAQELLQQRVVLRVGDIGEVLPDRISECIVDSVPVGKHQQPRTVRTEQRALEVPPELYSGQMVAVHCSD